MGELSRVHREGLPSGEPPSPRGNPGVRLSYRAGLTPLDTYNSFLGNACPISLSTRPSNDFGHGSDLLDRAAKNRALEGPGTVRFALVIGAESGQPLLLRVGRASSAAVVGRFAGVVAQADKGLLAVGGDLVGRLEVGHGRLRG